MKNQKKSLRKQKIYKMKGCSKKTRKHHLGGAANQPNLANYDLAYPAKGVTFLPNPALAYTGKGGSSNLACTVGLTPAPLAYTGTNTNAANPAYPSTGPPASSQNWLGSQLQGGGGCGCGTGNMLLKGGACSSCGVNYLVHAGGNRSLKHRAHCKCTECKGKSRKNRQKGGNGLPYGQGLPPMKDIPYPNGLTGAPWKPPIANWPGVDGISGDRNHLAYNTYSPNDVSRQMIATGANPPFSVGGGKKSKKQKGGVLSNFLGQDLVNLGRQFQFNLGSTYNALNGYQAPVNPLPWKDQLTSATNKF
jgi:hypothetical protein